MFHRTIQKINVALFLSLTAYMIIIRKRLTSVSVAADDFFADPAVVARLRRTCAGPELTKGASVSVHTVTAVRSPSTPVAAITPT